MASRVTPVSPLRKSRLRLMKLQARHAQRVVVRVAGAVMRGRDDVVDVVAEEVLIGCRLQVLVAVFAATLSAYPDVQGFLAPALSEQGGRCSVAVHGLLHRENVVA